MKKQMLMAVCAVGLLAGCATSGSLFGAAREVASTAPAIVEDTQSLLDKVTDLKGRVTAWFKPGTNTVAVAK